MPLLKCTRPGHRRKQEQVGDSQYQESRLEYRVAVGFNHWLPRWEHKYYCSTLAKKHNTGTYTHTHTHTRPADNASQEKCTGPGFLGMQCMRRKYEPVGDDQENQLEHRTEQSDSRLGERITDRERKRSGERTTQMERVGVWKARRRTSVSLGRAGCWDVKTS